jgi:hypothetical protein
VFTPWFFSSRKVYAPWFFLSRKVSAPWFFYQEQCPLRDFFHRNNIDANRKKSLLYQIMHHPTFIHVNNLTITTLSLWEFNCINMNDTVVYAEKSATIHHLKERWFYLICIDIV